MSTQLSEKYSQRNIENRLVCACIAENSQNRRRRSVKTRQKPQKAFPHRLKAAGTRVSSLRVTMDHEEELLAAANAAAQSGLIKLFVGQIPKTWEEEEVREILEPYGPIRELTILKDKMSGTHKGQGSLSVALPR